MKKLGRYICPRKHDFERLFADFRREKYGGKNGELMSQALDVRVKQNVEESSNSSVSFQKYAEWTSNMSFIVAIVTLLIKRVYEKVNFTLSLQVNKFPSFYSFFKKLELFIS